MSRKAWGKTSFKISVIKELERQARDIKKRQQELEKKARQEEERKKFEQCKSEMKSLLRTIQEIKLKLIKEDLLRSVETTSYEKRTQSLDESINNCTSLHELSLLKPKLFFLTSEWKELRARALANRECQRLEQEHKDRELAKLLSRVSEFEAMLNQFNSLDYAPAVKSELEQLFGYQKRVKFLLNSNQANEVNAILAKATTDLAEATSKAKIIWKAWVEKQTAIENTLNSLELKCYELRSNSVVLGWCRQELSDLENKIKHYRQSLSELVNYKEDAVQKCRQIESQLFLLNPEGIELQAYEKEQQENRRAYVVTGISSVLKEMGFVIDKGPDLLDQVDPTSTVLMEASLPTGKNVVVKINLNGAIYTDFNGYPDNQCIRDLEQFKDNLDNKFSVVYEVKGQQDHNPQKIKKGAKGVPGGINVQTFK